MKSSRRSWYGLRVIVATATFLLSVSSVVAAQDSTTSLANLTAPKQNLSNYPHFFSRTCPAQVRAWPDTDIRQPSAPNILPISSAGKYVGGSHQLNALRAVGAIWSQEALKATAVLVGDRYVLTVAHKIPNREWLSDHVFVVDWSVDYSTGDPKLYGSRQIRCFPLVIDEMVASPAGHLDYILVRISEEIDNRSKRHWPSHYRIEPLVPAKVVLLPIESELLYMVGAHQAIQREYDQPPEGMVAVVGGVVERVARWSKDAGTSRNIDYSIYSLPGLSGSALFNLRHQWIGMHQRDLNLAKCDDLTPWHPYLAEYYFDRLAKIDLPSRFKNQCLFGKPPSEPGAATPGDLPRQGSAIVDIAQDIVQRRGIEWACANVPKLVAILPALETYLCDNKRRASTTLVREKAAAPGID